MELCTGGLYFAVTVPLRIVLQVHQEMVSLNVSFCLRDYLDDSG